MPVCTGQPGVSCPVTAPHGHIVGCNVRCTRPLGAIAHWSEASTRATQSTGAVSCSAAEWPLATTRTCERLSRTSVPPCPRRLRSASLKHLRLMHSPDLAGAPSCSLVALRLGHFRRSPSVNDAPDLSVTATTWRPISPCTRLSFALTRAQDSLHWSDRLPRSRNRTSSALSDGAMLRRWCKADLIAQRLAIIQVCRLGVHGRSES